jgi:hypothetical protein
MKPLNFSKPVKTLYTFPLNDEYIIMTDEELILLAKTVFIDDADFYKSPVGSSNFSKLIPITNSLDIIYDENFKGAIVISIYEDGSLERHIIIID